MTNLDSIFKSRDITLPTKVHLVKAMAFPVFMYGCKTWAIKKAEHRRNEVERFYEDLQELLELMPKKDVLFIIGDWHAKVGSQETPGVTGKFGLEYRMKQGKD